MNLSFISKIFFTNTFYGFLKQGLAGIISIFLIPFFIYQAGDIVYGEYLLLQLFTIHGIFSYADFGITGSIVRYLTKYHASEDHKNFKNIFSSYFYLFALIGLIFSIFLYFNIETISYIFFRNSENIVDIKYSLIIISAMLLFNIPSLVVKSFFISIQKMWIVKIWEILYAIFFAIGVVYFLLYNFSFYGIFLFDLVLSLFLLILFSICGHISFKKYFTLSIFSFNYKSIKDSSEFSLYMFINKFIGLIVNKSPQLVLGAFFTANYLTYYTIFTKFPFLIKQIMGTLNSAVLPISVYLKEKNKLNEILSFLRFGTMLSIMSTFSIALYFIFYSDIILKFWVGEQYMFLSRELSIMMVWAMINTSSSFFVSMYNNINQLKIILPVSLFSLAIFIIGLLLSVVNEDISYIGLGFLLSALFSSISNILLLNHTFNIKYISYLKFILRYYLLSSLVVLLLYYLLFLLDIKVNLIVLITNLMFIIIVNFLLILREKNIIFLDK